jgi:hypothetical protein
MTGLKGQFLKKRERELTWQGKNCNALKDKKYLTGINKGGIFGIRPPGHRAKLKLDRFDEGVSHFSKSLFC